MLEVLSHIAFSLESLKKISTWALFLFFLLLVLVLIAEGRDDQKLFDRVLFWIIGFLLAAFAAFRPIGVSRDDVSYQEIVSKLCATEGCSSSGFVSRDFIWYELVKLGGHFYPGDFRVALVLSGLGVLIKLFVIDRLCTGRLLALLLFIPLCYVQYDLTQLRAGFAISWMMLGVYALTCSRVAVGSAFLGTNFAVHSQAIFSPALLGYRLVGSRRWVLPVMSSFILILIFLGFYPSVATLEWLGIINLAKKYYPGTVVGLYPGVKVFPLAYILILAYGFWLCDALRVSHRKVSEIASAGLLLGMVVAWFFVINPTVQTRVFEFYAVLLALLAGNVGHSKLKITLTCLLALVLYFRLEILHDWILG